jgi:hypothetical protein
MGASERRREGVPGAGESELRDVDVALLVLSRRGRVRASEVLK